MASTVQAPTRVSLEANRVVTGLLFAIAFLAFVVRCWIRHWVLRQFAIEDGIIVLAVVCLVATTALYYLTVQNLYDELAVILYGFGANLMSVLESIETEAKLANAMAILWWLVLFPIKLAYLFFFHRLIDRVWKLKWYWWFVTLFLIPSTTACLVASRIACPYTDPFEIIAKCSGPTADDRQVLTVKITTVFDVASDVFVASVPVILLWRVRIQFRQKLGLGIVLCLSLVMAIFAIIRAAGVRLPSGNVDIVWLAFWQQQECSVAVLMVSLTAFRSFFVAGPAGVGAAGVRKARKAQYTSTYWKQRLLQRKKGSEKGPEIEVTIPSATLTGMGTVIRGGPAKTWSDRSVDEDIEALPAWPLDNRSAHAGYIIYR